MILSKSDEKKKLNRKNMIYCLTIFIVANFSVVYLFINYNIMFSTKSSYFWRKSCKKYGTEIKNVLICLTKIELSHIRYFMRRFMSWVYSLFLTLRRLIVNRYRTVWRLRAMQILALEFLSKNKKGSRKRRGPKCLRNTQSCGELFSQSCIG